MVRERPFMRGLGRGLMRRCPNCGIGPLFSGFLTVEPICPVCEHENGRYPSDDVPPYVTILLVGHLVLAPALIFGFVEAWTVGTSLAVLLPAIAGLTLLLLPVVKGGVIGAEWSLGVMRETPKPL
jgi:uncharacterized protein (DUF983 family)